MFDCTLTEVEVWADDASNFRTRWRFYNRMKERKVDAAARQPLVLSKKYFLPNVMQLKENGSFGECLVGAALFSRIFAINSSDQKKILARLKKMVLEHSQKIGATRQPFLGQLLLFLPTARR